MENPEKRYCAYGAGVVHNQLDALESLFIGAIQSKDIEYVHKTRVMLRRIRTALRLFDACFRDAENRKHFRTLRSAAKTLGKARDLDVKILYLEEYIKKLRGQDKASIDLLLIEHKDQRTLLQDGVIFAINGLKESGALGGLRDSCTEITDKSDIEPGSSALMHYAILEKINERIKEVLDLRGFVGKERETLMHHKIRIAIKHLRYALEIYAPLYGNGFSHEINRLKKMQDVLGEMHDCDVWVEHLSGMSTDEGIREFLAKVKAERKMLYREFLVQWKKSEAEKLFDKVKDAAVAMYNHERRKDAAAVEKASIKYGTGGGHSSQVKSIATQLFDGLSLVHNLGPEERFLLECAAILHDVGWSEGQKNHHKTSMKLILSDPQLPFTKNERLICASIARYHRKRLPKKTDANLRGLKPLERKNTEKLAALMRIADALDASHHSVINTLTVRTKGGKTVITAKATGEVESENAAFTEKKDLFMKAFSSDILVEWRKAT
jgi:CHAD domain-containing protein